MSTALHKPITSRSGVLAFTEMGIQIPLEELYEGVNLSDVRAD